MTSLAGVAEQLNKARRLILSGHIMPDGDCLGSVAALGLALEKKGKLVTLASPDPLPEVYQFLPGADRFVIGEQALAGGYDTFVMLDCSVPDRLGSLKELLFRELVVCSIDHHTSTHIFAHCQYVDAKAAATGEIIQDLLELMEIPITEEIATCLYTAIVTDTGSFRYENTSPLTHYRAARLMEQGVDAARLNVLVFEQKSLLHMRVLQAALQTLDLTPCGRVAWISVFRETLDKLGAGDEHADGLIDYVRSLRGVEVALLFRELVPGRWKVSLRSKGKVDVNQVAAQFNGGGHTRAAGAVVEGESGEIINTVVLAVLEAL